MKRKKTLKCYVFSDEWMNDFSKNKCDTYGGGILMPYTFARKSDAGREDREYLIPVDITIKER